MEYHLLFHAPCFDGLVSAVFAADLLERPGRHLSFHPVGYGVKDRWLGSAPAPSPFGVVDFLYHPAADFWVDHHRTAFLTEEARESYESRRAQGDRVLYDKEAPSCAALMWRQLPLPRRDRQREELAKATVKTDSARYESPREAVFGNAPPLVINRSLHGASDALVLELLALLREHPLREVAKHPAVVARAADVDEAAQRALGVVERRIRMIGTTAYLEWNASDGPLNRYLPYLVCRDAAHSVVITHMGDGLSKLTAMRNPWLEPSSADIGVLVEALGGGGHRRVGSAFMRAPDTDVRAAGAQLAKTLAAAT